MNVLIVLVNKTQH